MIRLHLKEDASEYCQYDELKRLFQRQSSSISYPIYLMKILSTQEKVEQNDAEIEAEIEKVTEQWKAEGKDVDEEAIENSINRTTTRTVDTTKFERMNEAQAPLDSRKIWNQKARAQTVLQGCAVIFIHGLTSRQEEEDVDFTGLPFVPESSLRPIRQAL